MKYDVNLLDKEFSNDSYGLYVIIDSTTNIEVSPVFPLQNDVLAITAFIDFLEKQKEKKPKYSKYILRTVGVFNAIKHEISSGEFYDICSEDEDLNSYLDEVCNSMKNEEEV